MSAAHTDRIPDPAKEIFSQAAIDEVLDDEAALLSEQLGDGRLTPHQAAARYGRACQLLGRPDPYATPHADVDADNADNDRPLPWWAR